MLTRAHFQYLKLENEVTIEVLAGRLSKREADHKLRSARQVLGYLTVEPSSDRIAPCSRCGQRRLLEFYLHSDSLDLLVCRECGLAAQALTETSSRTGSSRILVKKVA